MPSTVIYVKRTRAETKILEEKTNTCSVSFEGFHAQLDCKLTHCYTNQGQLTLVHSTYSFVFKNRAKQELL